MRADLAALDEDLFGQRDADGFAGAWRSRVAAHSSVSMALDRADLVARREQHPVADPQRAGFDAARQDAAVVEPVNVLDREPQRQVAAAVRRPENRRAPAAPSGRCTTACCADCVATLSPSVAEIGMNSFGVDAELARGNARYSSSMRLKDLVADNLSGPSC